VCLHSGLRIGEATALRRRDVSAGSVTVRSTAVEIKGVWQEQPPKTRAGRRPVPVPQTVADAFRSHMEQYSQPGGARVSCSRRLRASQCVCLPSERERSRRRASERVCQVYAYTLFVTRQLASGFALAWIWSESRLGQAIRPARSRSIDTVIFSLSMMPRSLTD
jgi:integrase